MKITLAFQVFNKAHWLEPLMASWLDRLSGAHEVEVIAVFDDLEDGSDEVAAGVVLERRVPYKFLYAQDGWEVVCNNLALREATGDVIVFIQDDNWIYDAGWDDTLAQVFARLGDRAGLVGLLAGGTFDGAAYTRVEADRPRKHRYFSGFGIPDAGLAVHALDFVIRPLAARTEVMRRAGGFDMAYARSSWNDMDLCMRLSYNASMLNVYVPFDLLNLAANVYHGGPALDSGRFQRGRDLFMGRWGGRLQGHQGRAQKVFDLKEVNQGLTVDE